MQKATLDLALSATPKKGDIFAAARIAAIMAARRRMILSRSATLWP